MSRANLFFIVLFFSVSAALQAQLKEKDHLLGPSLGLFPQRSALTLGFNYEYQLVQEGIGTISLGGIFRYTSFRDDYPFDAYFDNTYVTFGVQSNYNFNQIGDGKFVPFAGLVLGYNTVSFKFISKHGYIYTQNIDSGFWLWVQGGMRYFFSPTVAGAVRIGLGNFNFNVFEIGVDFKL
jgi:hypothetical protein